MKFNKLTFSLLALSFLTLSCSNDDNNNEPNNTITVQDFSVTVDENPMNGESLGIVSASSSEVLSYSIESSTPANALSIDVNTGELTVTDETLFDYETNTVITATITVENSTEMETINVTIDLEDLAEIGEFKYGGVIFWVNATGDEGYVVSMTDQSTAAPFGCLHTATGATGVNIGTGQANTNTILSICSTSGTAADLVNNLNSNGYSDWFLPSEDELGEIMNNKVLINISLENNGGTALLSTWGDYWTSTEVNAAEARFYNPTNDWFPTDYKSNLHPVRAVRHWTDF